MRTCLLDRPGSVRLWHCGIYYTSGLSWLLLPVKYAGRFMFIPGGRNPLVVPGVVHVMLCFDALGASAGRFAKIAGGVVCLMKFVHQ